MSPTFPDTPHVYLPATAPISAPNRWVLTAEAVEGLAKLKADDKTAWQELMSRMQRCARRGAKANDPDLRAPVGQQFTPKLNGPQPWLGELKQTGSVLGTKVGESAAQYRLYFGDIEDQAGQPAAQMLAADLREKWIAGSDAENLSRQDRDMETSMRRIIHWCQKHSRGYRRAAE